MMGLILNILRIYCNAVRPKDKKSPVEKPAVVPEPTKDKRTPAVKALQEKERKVSIREALKYSNGKWTVTPVAKDEPKTMP